MFDRLFCKHEWIKDAEISLPSAWEQIHAAGKTVSENWTCNLFRKKLVILMHCSKCGWLVTKEFNNP